LKSFSGRAGLLDLSDATKPEPPEAEDFSPSDIGEGGEHVSGMHMVNPDTHWSYPSVGLADDSDEEEGDLKKEALGLTDIPASVDGGEVLDFAGIPQNPGLSRESGEDEETDYFGAESEIMEEVPPKNKRYKTYEYLGDLVDEEELNFFDFLEDTVKTTRSYLEHVGDLHKALLKIGNSEDALVLYHILKRSGKISQEPVTEKAKTYYLAKKTLLAKAASKEVRIDYEPRSWSDGVSFIFKGAHGKGGEWYYDHGTAMSECAVSEIVSGEKEPSWLGLEPYQLEAIAELDELGSDLIGGVAFLHSFASKRGAMVDWVDSSVAVYHNALTDAIASLKSVTTEVLDDRTVYGSDNSGTGFEGKMEEYLRELKADLESLDRVKEAAAVELINKTAQIRGPGGIDLDTYETSTPVAKPKSEPVVKSRISVEPAREPWSDEQNMPFVSYSSIDEMVSAGLITQKDAQDLRTSGQSFGVDYLARQYGLDREYAKQLADLLLEEASRPAGSGGSTSAKYRFPYSETVKAVQRAIGTDDDGWWGRNTDAAWNARMDQLGPDAAPYKVGGEAFPGSIEAALQVLTSATDTAPPAATQPAAKTAPEEAPQEATEAPEEAQTPQDADQETRSAIERIELSLTDPRKGKPEMMSFIAGTDARRGVALIQWPEETDTSKKYDTIVQLDDGTWELGAATRREMRALRRPYLKDVRKEMRRERKDLSRKERRQLRREERKRRREASFDEEVTVKTAKDRMSERAKRLLE
jgi:hypothetical protein